MKRRLFLGLITSLLFAPSVLLAGETVDYKPGLIKKELAAGKTVFVDYAADWCGTCKRQERILSMLRSKTKHYDDSMTFVRVDWDEYSNHEVTTSRKIPRRSTLIVLKGDKELGRIVAGTNTEEIKQLLDKGITKF